MREHWQHPCAVWKCGCSLNPGARSSALQVCSFTSVIYRKENDGKRFLVVDAAMNDLIRPALYGAYHEIVPVVRDVGSAAEVKPRNRSHRYRRPSLRDRGFFRARPRVTGGR